MAPKMSWPEIRNMSYIDYNMLNSCSFEMARRTLKTLLWAKRCWCYPPTSAGPVRSIMLVSNKCVSDCKLYYLPRFAAVPLKKNLFKNSSFILGRGNCRGDKISLSSSVPHHVGMKWLFRRESLKVSVGKWQRGRRRATFRMRFKELLENIL